MDKVNIYLKIYIKNSILLYKFHKVRIDIYIYIKEVLIGGYTNKLKYFCFFGVTTIN